MSKIKKMSSFIVVCLMIFSMGCNQKIKKEKNKKVTIAQFGHLLVYLPIYLAKHKGYFEEEGLEVKYVSTGGDEKTYAALVGGSAQFGVSDPTFVAIAREKGNDDGVILGSIIDGVPFWGVAKKGTVNDILNPLDFDELRVATYQAPSTNYSLFKRIINKNELKKAKIVQGAYGSLLATLEAGEADVAMMLEPNVSKAFVNGYDVVFKYATIYDSFALTGIYSLKQIVENDPELVRKVIRAIGKAEKFCHSDFEATVNIAKKEFPDIEIDVLKEAVKRMLDDKTIPTSVIMSKTSWDNAIDLRLEIGDLKNKADFNTNVNNTFSEQIERELSQN